MHMIEEIKKELSSLERTPRELRTFGLLMSTVLMIVAGVMIWSGASSGPLLAAASVAMFLTAAVLPRSLLYPYIAWMAFALTLGWVMTRLVLSFVYFVLIAPIGLMMRLAGKDLLDLRIERRAESYWKRHDAGSGPERYMKQF